MEILPEDLIIDTFRSRQRGDVAGVRIIHKPSGLVAMSSDQPSTELNHRKAMEILKQLLQQERGGADGA